jgi:hypothetical protein
MNDNSDDPVMALLATQRAVLAAVENLAGQVQAMQSKVDATGEKLAQLVAGRPVRRVVARYRLATASGRRRPCRRRATRSYG